MIALLESQIELINELQDKANQSGSEIATDWSPMRPKIRCWRPEI